MTLLRVANSSNPTDALHEPASGGGREVLSEEAFRRMIAIERKRTERTKEPFLLMLLEAGHYQGSSKNGRAIGRMVSALLSSIRDTDVIGWYKDTTTIGLMYTALSGSSKNAVLSTILNRVSATLGEELTSDQFSEVSISFHFFPDDWNHENSGRPNNPALYPDLSNHDTARRSVLAMKRSIDVVGSTLMLVLCSPVLLAIALAIKATSKGPILFRQQRVGQYGQCFTFLKFRSMHVNNDHSVHRDYVTKLIADEAEGGSSKNPGVYKLTNDKRITPVGSFLRRTSLDELPQFLNVLKGDMSLVGPRPAIPYEVAVYQTWHRRRVLEVKPGITGLWQITSRSRVKFDDMVRLDLRYATSWTPWLDFKILMRTPLAVIRGDGAC